jgi:hypothetical protein
MLILLPIHIAIALSSVIYTAFVYVMPSKRKLHVSYTLVGLTVATGTALVVMRPAHLAESCLSGLLYLGVAFSGIIMVRRRLARQED